MDILLNNDEDRKLNQAKVDFEEACDVRSLEPADQKPLQEHISCVTTAVDSFKSTTFIVSCVGMLKSGKSTLVNLFARSRLASPTGYGFDTTLRPALVMNSKNEEGCVEIWLSGNPSKPLTKAVFDKLFFHLRGVGGPDNIPEVVCHSYPLTEANLFNALCKEEREAENNMLPAEPALVVVKVPKREDSLLRSEVMILDTPGLDSGHSEWTSKNSERYSWIISNSDLLLFLQSSVSPLNKRAGEVLRDIRAHNSTTPVWLIQNEMVLKHWLPEERIKAETEDQRKLASRMFDRISHAFKQVNANLGKAYSAIFDESLPREKRDGLLPDSQFLSMEKNIREDLLANIAPIRRANCKANVLREIGEMKALAEKMMLDAESEKVRLSKKIKEMESFKTNLKNILLKPPQGQKFQIVGKVEDIETSGNIPFDVKKLQTSLRNSLTLEKRKYRISDIEEIIKTAKDKLTEEIAEQINKTKLNHFYLNIGGVKQADDIGKYYKAEFCDKVKKLIRSNHEPGDESFRRTMEELVGQSCEQVDFPEDFPLGCNVKVDHLDNIDVSIGTWLKRVWTFFVPESRSDAEGEISYYFDGKNGDGEFVKLIKACDSKMKENLFAWLNDDVYQTMRQDFIDKISGRIDSGISGLKGELAKQGSKSVILEKMLDGCSTLAKAMEIF